MAAIVSSNRTVEQLFRTHSNENLIGKPKSSPPLNAKSTNCLSAESTAKTKTDAIIQNDQLDEYKAFIQQQKIIEQKIYQQNKKLKQYKMQKQFKEHQQPLRPENQFLSASLFFDPTSFASKAQRSSSSHFNRSSSTNKSKTNLK